MPTPVTVDLSGGGGPWPAITISGCTGADAALVNGTWTLMPGQDPEYGYRYYAKAGAQLRQPDEGFWEFYKESSTTVLWVATVEATWPHQVGSAEWAVDSGSVGGTLALAFALAAPVAVELEGAEATTYATLTTALVGANNDVEYEALLPRRLGNDIRIRYIDPNGGNGVFSVSVSARDITVNLATDSSGDITTTAAQVKAAIEASAEASALVTVTNQAGNDGSGVITQAFSYTALAGGTGGLPLPPETVTI